MQDNYLLSSDKEILKINKALAIKFFKNKISLFRIKIYNLKILQPVVIIQSYTIWEHNTQCDQFAKEAK